MSGLLTLSELADRSGVSVPRLQRFAEADLLAPARQDGDRYGYPPAEAGAARVLAGAEDLGIDPLVTFGAGWRDDDCAGARLQAVAAALTGAAHEGLCGQDCGCATALSGDAVGTLTAVVGLGARFPTEQAP
ncbi:hypothetical protein OHA21_15425 [Actinoplanes sp. NBC_00393]|uniref:hypothetical protein n=1 Tax=Actinoplanes sp. NBC_00393 TaxID=2975953 RepID=UPI002E2391EF